MAKRMLPRQRFESHIDRDGPINPDHPEYGPCWYYTGTSNGRGYHQTSLDGERVYVHRVSYEWFVGPIPDGMLVDHVCHNLDESCPGGWDCPHRACMNPAHLALKSPRENTHASAVAPAAINARKTHCPRDHPYDEENTEYRYGYRYCKACRRNRSGA